MPPPDRQIRSPRAELDGHHERGEQTDELDAMLRPSRASSARAAALEWLIRRRWWCLAVGAVAVAGSFALAALQPARPGDVVEVLPVAADEAANPSAADPSAAGQGAGASATASSVENGPSVSPSSSAESPSVVAVHVAGAVHRPGVVYVESTKRVSDAIAAAGGARSDADVHRINLAVPLADGSWIYVPAVGESEPPAGPIEPAGGQRGAASGGGGGTVSEAPLVNLNTATAEELETLPGVGPATAAAIIAHRDKVGPFASPEALDDVRGFGPAKVAAVIDLVEV